MDVNDNVILKKIEELAAAAGLEVLEGNVYHMHGLAIVRAVVDYPNGGVLLDACAVLNKEIRRYLEESQLFGDDFSIEINSPGLDRKLHSVKDFKRICGRGVMLWLSEKFENKDYHEGVLKSVDENKLVLEVKDKELSINFSIVKVGKEKIII